MTGYLTQRGEPDGNRFQLAIPNREVRNIFTEQIISLFKETAARDGEALKRFCDSLEQGKADEVERQLISYFEKTISIRDTFARKPTIMEFCWEFWALKLGGPLRPIERPGTGSAIL